MVTKGRTPTHLPLASQLPLTSSASPHPPAPCSPQIIGLLVPPLLYMRLATVGLGFSTLCMLWSLWVPTVRATLQLSPACTMRCLHLVALELRSAAASAAHMSAPPCHPSQPTQASGLLYLLTAITASTWSPLLAYPFIDSELARPALWLLRQYRHRSCPPTDPPSRHTRASPPPCSEQRVCVGARTGCNGRV